MSDDARLREKLRKIEALFAGAGTEGERLAAEAALERVRARLTELGRHEKPTEFQFSVPDTWSRHLFLALCRRDRKSTRLNSSHYALSRMPSSA